MQRRLSSTALIVAAVLLLAAGGVRAQMLAPLGPLEDGVVSYYIEEPLAEAGARTADVDLALWAFESWQRATEDTLKFVPAEREDEALVRLYWVPAAGGQYGEMRPLTVSGRRGAAVYIRPDTRALGPEIGARAEADPLFRDTIVYLTCLHELGHALGLSHTAEFADVMYFFGFGGDIEEFFGRYRRTLGERGDIRRSSGLSGGDLEQLRGLYDPAAVPGQLKVAN